MSDDEPPPAATPTALVSGVPIPDDWGSVLSETPPAGTDRPFLSPAPAGANLGFRARYAVVYDVAGPRVRLGIGWALLVAASIAYRPGRPYVLGALFGGTAAWAAFQSVTAWWPDRRSASRWVAAAGAGALPLATSIFGVRGTGVTLLVFAAGAVAVANLEKPSRGPIVMAAGRVASCGLWAGLASAAVVLTLRYEIGAAITLLVLVAVYEASDYIVGSGASNPVEGPLAGIISIAVVTAIVAFLRVPPFSGLDALAFGGLAAVGCPLGQLVGSAVLPAADASAPALRRLDSLLVLAPTWAWLVGLLVTRSA